MHEKKPAAMAASGPAGSALKWVGDAAAGAGTLEMPAASSTGESRVIYYDGAAWESVRALPYRSDSDVDGVTRRVLAAPADAAFEVRYFEVDPGSATARDFDPHVSVVVCMRGCGQVKLGGEIHDVGFGDVVYVAPGETHQFRNPTAEPFGFLCVVDRERPSQSRGEG